MGKKLIKVIIFVSTSIIIYLGYSFWEYQNYQNSQSKLISHCITEENTRIKEYREQSVKKINEKEGNTELVEINLQIPSVEDGCRYTYPNKSYSDILLRRNFNKILIH